ncbi:MAG: MBOAT family O-acyltransferase [Ferruginibacter sp.]
MIFNSIPFTGFFVIFFLLYWFVFNRNIKLQNGLILAGSYFFYAWWDWRFLALLVGSSLLNYLLGIWIARSTSEKKRNGLLYLGLLQGLGGLIFFKYYNFFLTSFAHAFSEINIELEMSTLNIILPLGISFYTFRTISYLLDVHKNKIKPSTDWVVFFSYVGFFPSLISGPIDKAKLLIPQLENKREFSNREASTGLRQILWGLFKKLVIADNCSDITNHIFNNYPTLPASTLVLGALFYTIQLYADFSGYSDMAIGFARLLGFNITKNFNYPFFAQNIADYWRRWHISLTAWLTEYVFTPLSIKFRDYGKAGLALAIIINFTICGLWHGANWTFVLYGFLHGCYFIPLIIKGTLNKKRKKGAATLLPGFAEFGNMVATFIVVMFTNILFRSDSIVQATDYFGYIFSMSIFSLPVLINKAGTVIVFSASMFFVEWLGRNQNFALETLEHRFPKPARWAIYYGLAMLIFLFAGKNQQFIYVQF